MKHLLLTLAAAILFSNFAAASAESSVPENKSTVTTERTAKKKRTRRLKDFAEEEQALQEALKTLFNPANYSVTGLSAKESNGEKILSGTVSFFGNEGVKIECVLSADTKLKTINTTFPASATFTIGHLDKLSQGEFRSLLPASLANAGISIQSFAIHFDESGKNLASFESNLAATNWDFLDFSGFKMNALTLKLELFKSPAKVGGELAGEVTIGNLKTQLNGTMVPDQPIVFVGTIPGGQGKINLKDALYSIAGKEETDRFIGLVPGEVFNALVMPELALTAIPGDKKISLASLTEMGNMELAVQKKGAKKDIKLILQAKDLGKILQTDIFKDIQLANPLVLISSAKDRDVKIPSGEEGLTADLEEGMNILTGINLGDDIKKIFKMEKINLSGSIDKGKRMKLAAKQEMDLPIGDGGVKFTGVSFGLHANPAPKFMMDGTISIPLKDNQFLKFTAGLSTAPIPPQFGGALTLVTDGGDDIWRNPLGVPGVGIKNLHGAIMMTPAPPFLTELELAGEILLGKNLNPEGN
ncbi:MAG: hypothetical protein RIA63_00295, partial [Cyclobacteriaceae bacterium]